MPIPFNINPLCHAQRLQKRPLPRRAVGVGWDTNRVATPVHKHGPLRSHGRDTKHRRDIKRGTIEATGPWPATPLGHKPGHKRGLRDTGRETRGDTTGHKGKQGGRRNKTRAGDPPVMHDTHHTGHEHRTYLGVPNTWTRPERAPQDDVRYKHPARRAPTPPHNRDIRPRGAPWGKRARAHATDPKVRATCARRCGAPGCWRPGHQGRPLTAAACGEGRGGVGQSKLRASAAPKKPLRGPPTIPRDNGRGGGPGPPTAYTLLWRIRASTSVSPRQTVHILLPGEVVERAVKRGIVKTVPRMGHSR